VRSGVGVGWSGDQAQQAHRILHEVLIVILRPSLCPGSYNFVRLALQVTDE
jgi:hypothetical protein